MYDKEAFHSFPRDLAHPHTFAMSQKKLSALFTTPADVGMPLHIAITRVIDAAKLTRECSYCCPNASEEPFELVQRPTPPQHSMSAHAVVYT